MRKNFYTLLFIILLGGGLIFLAAPSFAQTPSATCSWSCCNEPTNPGLCEDVQNYCLQFSGATPGVLGVGGGYCSGASGCGMYDVPMCCCNKGTFVGGTLTPKTPEINSPQLQINIPGLKEFSKVTCTTDEDGNYNCPIPWLGEYIVAIYNYGVGIAGILAAIVLMAGGILWLISGGDSSKVGQAKELIAGSLTGLIILLASYILLAQINPGLVTFGSISARNISQVSVDAEPVSAEGNALNSKDCNNCTEIKNIPFKNGRLANTALNDKLQTAKNNSPADLGWRVTEAYPPSSEHNSACHYNGMCVDIALFPASNPTNCDKVASLISILKNSGLQVLNEYPSCKGVTTSKTTGGHLHVR